MWCAWLSPAGLVAQMKDNGNQWQFKGITVKLANAFGYCWGVERAVQMAYEARRAYPGQKLHITNEIIHNPAVNQVRALPVHALSATPWTLSAMVGGSQHPHILLLVSSWPVVPRLRGI